MTTPILGLRSRAFQPLCGLVVCLAFQAILAAETPVKVFVLAGQSNMEGKARVSLVKYQLSQPATSKHFSRLVDGDGNWIVRDDVWIKFLNRSGRLTVGFGSPDRIGPELGFGNVVGDHFDEEVVLIKTAWGGKSLYRDFRPPSSGLPSDDALNEMLSREQKRRPNRTLEEIKSSFGHFYRAMIDEVKQATADLGAIDATLKGRQVELAGFVWFQGWNDMVNDEYTKEYSQNLANLIQDVRRDLDAPKLPCVVGVMGVGGMNVSDKHKAFRNAQKRVLDNEEMGNLALVETGRYWDLGAQKVFDRGWRKHVADWERVGSDYPFHYLGSGRTFHDIGRGFGRAMLLVANEKPDPSSVGYKLESSILVEDDVRPENYLGLPELSIEVEDQPTDAAKPKPKKHAFYDPIEASIEGWTVRVDPQLDDAANQEVRQRAFDALANHLQRVRFILPKDKLKAVQALPIWIELNNERIGGMQYHPGRGWLVKNGYDPRLVKHVHIPKARELYNPKMWAKHPYVVLHELAHAYHDQVLGFENAEIAATYEAAKAAGSYDKVLLYTGEVVKHYGMNNPKEYFAEATEAYFGVNDFYPFVRAELREHDPRMFKLLEETWGVVAE